MVSRTRQPRMDMARRLALAGILCATLVSTVRPASPRFYPDDPLWTDDDRVFDASKVVAIEDPNGYDFVVNTFIAPGERRDVRAMNVNSVDEVPDSSWFANRIGRRDMEAALSLDIMKCLLGRACPDPALLAAVRP